MPLGPGGLSYSHDSNGRIAGAAASSANATGGKYVENVTVTTLANAANNTLTPAQVVGGLILRDCNAGARTDTLPTATLLRDFFVGPNAGPAAANKGLQVGSVIYLHIRNNTGTAQTLTIAAGTGGTMSGTATIAQNNARDFMIVFTNVSNSPAYTVYSLGSSAF